MIPSIDQECQAWGRHKLWLMYGNHGWAPLSLLGKLIAEGYGAGQGCLKGSFIPKVVMKSPELYERINLALVKMTETHEMFSPWVVMHAHYLVHGKAKQKAPMLKLSVSQYWNELQVAHSFIAGCAPSSNVPREAEVYRQYLASV